MAPQHQETGVRHASKPINKRTRPPTRVMLALPITKLTRAVKLLTTLSASESTSLVRRKQALRLELPLLAISRPALTHHLQLHSRPIRPRLWDQARCLCQASSQLIGDQRAVPMERSRRARTQGRLILEPTASVASKRLKIPKRLDEREMQRRETQSKEDPQTRCSDFVQSRVQVKASCLQYSSLLCSQYC